MKLHNDAAPFAMAAIAGMALWFVAVAVTGKREPWDHDFYWSAVYPLAMVACGVLGGLYPVRPWRWALTLFLGQFVAMVIRNGELGGLWPMGMLLFCVLGVPGMLLGHLAAWGRARLARH